MAEDSQGRGLQEAEAKPGVLRSTAAPSPPQEENNKLPQHGRGPAPAAVHPGMMEAGRRAGAGACPRRGRSSPDAAAEFRTARVQRKHPAATSARLLKPKCLKRAGTTAGRRSIPGSVVRRFAAVVKAELYGSRSPVRSWGGKAQRAVPGQGELNYRFCAWTVGEWGLNELQ